MKKITVDGNEACARMSYYFTEVAGIYPITPSSPMAEHIDEWSKQKRKNKSFYLSQCQLVTTSISRPF